MGSSTSLRNSSAISVRFRPGVDDDIKNWWNNEPDRSYIIRRLIREYLAQGDQLSITPEQSIPEKNNTTVPISQPLQSQKPKEEQKPTQDDSGDPMSMGFYG